MAKLSKEFSAKYPFKCACCGEWFEAGSQALYVDGSLMLSDHYWDNEMAENEKKQEQKAFASDPDFKSDPAKIAEMQEKQLAFLQKQEPYEDWGSMNTFDCQCKTCNEGGVMHSCEGARCFILNHWGHYTWITNMGKVNPLAAGY